MFKKTISLIIMLFVLISATPMGVGATENSDGVVTINVNFNNMPMKAEVLMEGTDMLAPLDWLTYFGGMECIDNGPEYEFYYPEQSDEQLFARRIFISQDETCSIASCYYLNEDDIFDLLTGGFDYLSGLYEYAMSAFRDGAEMKDYLKVIGAYNAINEKDMRKECYVPIYESEFTKWDSLDGRIYVPIEELLPLMNAKVGVSDDGYLCIATNTSSLSKALYDADLGHLLFSADECLGTGFGRGAMDVMSYVSSSIANLRFNRLDFIARTGEIEDYETVFMNYLMDDEAYLTAFDDASPLKNELELLKDVFLGVDTAFGIFDDVKLSDDETNSSWLKYLQQSEKTLMGEDFHFWEGFGTTTEIIGEISDYAEFWYSYLYHINDHKEMLSAVYKYDVRTGINTNVITEDVTANIAVRNTENLYSDSVYTAAVSKGLLELQKEIKKDAVGAMTQKYSALTTALSVTTNILELIDSTSQALDIMDEGVLVNYMDASARKAYDVFWARLYNGYYDAKSLNEIRLCAIMTLVASKSGYEINILDGIYTDRVDEINEILKKLYLAADGIECESSDYYFEKSEELKNSIYRLTQNSNSSTFTSDNHGWRVTLTDDYVEHCIIEENRNSVCFMLRETQEYTGEDTYYDGMIFCITAFENSYIPDFPGQGFFIASNDKYDFYCQIPRDIAYNIDDPVQVELMERMRGDIGDELTGQIKEIIDSFEFLDSNYEITEEEAVQMVRDIMGDSIMMGTEYESNEYPLGLLSHGIGEKDGVSYYIIRMSVNTGSTSSTVGYYFVSVDGSEVLAGDYNNGVIYLY